MAGGKTFWRADGLAVWDRWVRIFHWSVAVAVSVSLATGLAAPVTWLRWHLIAGTIVAGLIYARVVWGFLGTRYARFDSFLYSPAAVVSHVRGIFVRRPGRHVGHNPLGALMVFGFLAGLTTMTITGAIALGGYEKQGPAAPFIAFHTGQRTLAFHYWLAIAIVAMIALHLGGVAVESALSRENLVRAMITGRKALPPANSEDQRGRGSQAFWLVALGLASATGLIVALASLPGRGVPPATLDPTWTEQCGACHFAFPPVLAPASAWDGIFADLKHHFANSNASLSPELALQLRRYADANSSYRWDTLPAHAFRIRDSSDSGRITKTPAWRRIHAGIHPSVFASDAVGSKAACVACHTDAATSRFAPQRIDIP